MNILHVDSSIPGSNAITRHLSALTVAWLSHPSLVAQAETEIERLFCKTRLAA
ncbi:hypothetical protein [Bradyrhizobium sp. 1]|uniref:hypothetical protein n=1 Tax=Bradyrhizobium sp. 1 TaxID=241591 RepID=UPI001FF9A292|nr:hypothetical protein [Bradyrhizobium sp. 1]MCK1392015.1 hypothetical protein [Bradyrhizobium sp. 1]